MSIKWNQNKKPFKLQLVMQQNRTNGNGDEYFCNALYKKIWINESLIKKEVIWSQTRKSQATPSFQYSPVCVKGCLDAMKSIIPDISISLSLSFSFANIRNTLLAGTDVRRSNKEVMGYNRPLIIPKVWCVCVCVLLWEMIWDQSAVPSWLATDAGYANSL